MLTRAQEARIGDAAAELLGTCKDMADVFSDSEFEALSREELIALDDLVMQCETCRLMVRVIGN